MNNILNNQYVHHSTVPYVEHFQHQLSPPFMPPTTSLQNKLWESHAILLSQILNYRLNLPRPNERGFHTQQVQDTSKNFNIEQWAKICPSQELYHMSLTGHLIKIINMLGGKASLQTLIDLTEPFLPYLRKHNGKNFVGNVVRTVKGCLSADVFYKDDHNNCSLNNPKVDEFIEQANIKLINYLEKISRSFPPLDKVIKRNKKGIKRKSIKSIKLLKQQNEIIIKQESSLKQEDGSTKDVKQEKPIEEIKICMSIHEQNKLKMICSDMENYLPQEQIPLINTQLHIMDYCERQKIGPMLFGYIVAYELIQQAKYH